MRDLKPRLGSACNPSPCPSPYFWHVSSALQLRDTFGQVAPDQATGGPAVGAGRPGRGIDDFFPRLAKARQQQARHAAFERKDPSTFSMTSTPLSVPNDAPRRDLARDASPAPIVAAKQKKLEPLTRRSSPAWADHRSS